MIMKQAVAYRSGGLPSSFSKLLIISLSLLLRLTRQSACYKAEIGCLSSVLLG